MTPPTIVIVGGGPAGLACAVTLASAVGQHGMPSDLHILVLDDGRSDLLAAELHNVVGWPRGTLGKAALDDMKARLASFGHAEFLESTVDRLDVTESGWQVSCSDGLRIPASFVVVASGYKEVRIEIPGTTLINHALSPKPRSQFQVTPNGQLAPGLYAAGTVAGSHSMFHTAVGSGVDVACRILGEFAGGPTHVHDSPGTRKAR